MSKCQVTRDTSRSICSASAECGVTDVVTDMGDVGRLLLVAIIVGEWIVVAAGLVVSK